MSKDQTERIIEAVLERITQMQQGQNCGGAQERPRDRILVLYGEDHLDVRESIRQVRILMERGYEVTHIYTPKMLNLMNRWKNAGKIEWYPDADYSEDDVFLSMEILEQTDLVVLPTWSSGFLTQLLEGHEDNLVQILLQEVLCREMPLLMAEETDRGRYQKSAYYQTYLAGKAEAMQKYGAKMLPVRDLSGYILSGNYQTKSSMTEDRSGIFSESVFCSEDLKKVKDSRIVVGERTIVSPEAMDQAKERGIQIIKA